MRNRVSDSDLEKPHFVTWRTAENSEDDQTESFRQRKEAFRYFLSKAESGYLTWLGEVGDYLTYRGNTIRDNIVYIWSINTGRSIQEWNVGFGYPLEAPSRSIDYTPYDKSPIDFDLDALIADKIDLDRPNYSSSETSVDDNSRQNLDSSEPVAVSKAVKGRYIEVACDNCGLVIPKNETRSVTIEKEVGRSSGSTRFGRSSSSSTRFSSTSRGRTYASSGSGSRSSSSTSSGRTYYRTETLLYCGECYAARELALQEQAETIWRVAKVVFVIVVAVAGILLLLKS